MQPRVPSANKLRETAANLFASKTEGVPLSMGKTTPDFDPIFVREEPDEEEDESEKDDDETDEDVIDEDGDDDGYSE